MGSSDIKQAGWIKLHRSVFANWIWANAHYLKWWVDLILIAQWKDSKTILLGKLVNIERGQCAASVRYLCDRWAEEDSRHRKVKPSIKKVLHFLHLLEEDGCIVRDTKKLPRNTTLISIVNYNKYQGLIEESAEVTQKVECAEKPEVPSQDPKTEPNVENEHKVLVDEPKKKTLKTPSMPSVLKSSKKTRTSQYSTHNADNNKNKIEMNIEQESIWLSQFFSEENKEHLNIFLKDLHAFDPRIGPDSVDYLRSMAEAVIAEWRLIKLPCHDGYESFSRHLIGQIRKKNIKRNEQYYNIYGTNARCNDYQVERQRGDAAFIASLRSCLPGDRNP